MMNRYSNIAVLFVIFLFAACIKKKSFSDVPEIKLVDFKVFSHQENSKNKADSAYVTISFTDGDGDLGNPDSNALSMFLDYYEDQGSGFVYNNLTYSIYIPNLSPEGNNKAIEGTIQQKLNVPFYNEKSIYPYKYKIYVVDRAGHKSNVVETQSLTK